MAKKTLEETIRATFAGHLNEEELDKVNGTAKTKAGAGGSSDDADDTEGTDIKDPTSKKEDKGGPTPTVDVNKRPVQEEDEKDDDDDLKEEDDDDLKEEDEKDDDDDLKEEEDDDDEEMKEHMKVLFRGSKLSESFKKKAETIFRAAVNERVQKAKTKLREKYNRKLAEARTKSDKKLTEQINSYMTYTVNEWSEENKIALETGFRTEIAESLVTGLKELLEANYIDTPEEKIDLVNELTVEVNALKEQVTTVNNKNVELAERLTASKCKNILSEMVSDLALTEAEKLTALAEGIETTSPKAYRKALSTLKENYFPGKTSGTTHNTDTLLEDTSTVKEQTGRDLMDMYADACANLVKLNG